MNRQRNTPTESITTDDITRYIWILATVWTIVIAGLWAWNFRQTHQVTQQIAIAEARASFKKDQAFLFWATSHGGVYVPIDEQTPPNPYLSHIPEQDIETPSGKKLTLMPSTYMLRQLNEEYGDLCGIVGHLTSLNVLCPANAPDEWERAALLAFERGETEAFEFTEINGKPYLRLMQPMITQEGCLQCHGHQGYKVGDVRGGVGVSLPMSPLLAKQRQTDVTHSLTLVFLWLLGIGGLLTGGRSLSQRIGERTRAEEKLKKERIFSEKIVNNAKAIIVGLDSNHCIRLFNKGAEKITGYKKDDVMGKDWFEIFFPREMLAEMYEVWQKAWGTEPYPHINAIRCQSGEFKIISWQNTGIYDGDDISEHILISIGEDITERKEMEDSLKKREEQLRTLINSTPDIICFKDGQGRWLEANEADLKLFQLENVDYRGKKDSELAQYSKFYDDVFKTCKESDETAWQKGTLSRGIEIIPKPDGSKRIYDVIKVPLFEEDGARKGLVVLGRDITAMKKVEQRLHNEREKLFVTLQSIGDGVITTDTECRVTFINSIAEQLTAWNQEEAAGQPLSNVFNIINEKTGLTCENPVKKVLDSGKIIGLANHTALIARDSTRRSIADSGAPILDAQGKIIGVVLVFRDVTEEKKREEEQLKIKKLESVGVLAGGIAHDFNNILMAILGNINLADISIGKDHQAHRLLQAAEKASLRAKDLTSQLLTFAKGGDPVRKTASITQVITDSADFVLHGSNVKCRYAIPEDLWLVDIDTGQMSQVIQNLVINAHHAMPEGGEIKISCENIADITTETALGQPGEKYIKITITDTGGGIPEKYLDKIFDPYFSTKQKGSGLGLAITHSIINKHDGHITVRSKSGEGTKFTIYLPAVAEQKFRDGGEEAQKPEKTARGTILVMDDEEMIRDLAKEMLSNFGHEVLQAKDGREAIAIFKEHNHSDNPVDVIIMDLTIPGGMGGKDAIKEILKIDPDAKAIVSSGYANDPVMANYRQYGFKAAIGKPFQMAQLRETINSVLG